jgi:TRAP-type uncharacterized transport system fused permease subunit
MGTIVVVLSLEVTRRTVGWTLAVIGMFAIAYVFLGPYMPGLLFNRSYSLDRFIGMQFMSFDGVFGLVANIFATSINVMKKKR